VVTWRCYVWLKIFPRRSRKGSNPISLPLSAIKVDRVATACRPHCELLSKTLDNGIQYALGSLIYQLFNWLYSPSLSVVIFLTRYPVWGVDKNTIRLTIWLIRLEENEFPTGRLAGESAVTLRVASRVRHTSLCHSVTVPTWTASLEIRGIKGLWLRYVGSSDIHTYTKYLPYFYSNEFKWWQSCFVHKVPRLIQYLGLIKCWAVMDKDVLNMGHFTTRLCYWR
jgi:hypothetical protein